MRKPLAALTLAAALAAGRPAVLDQLWSLLTSLWSASTADAGCGADPDGRCLPPPQTDEGCIGDPNGRCNPPPQTDAGCGADPSGGPCGS